MVDAACQPARHQCGATMIEVLVTLVIIAFGLLGMVGLQARLQVSEVESFQRGQALLLANDMANRIAVNRNNAASYVTGANSPVGGATACSTATSTSTRAQIDLIEWCNSLRGAAEISSGAQVGALIGGRGCVELSGGEYLITVAWQGLAAYGAPPSSVACGLHAYNGASGTPCVSDACRRVVTTVVRVAGL